MAGYMMSWGKGHGEGWRKGPWTAGEDKLLIEYVSLHGDKRWTSVARYAGLQRNGKSCRLRWVNYLRPDLKNGHITPHEENIILELHAKWGNRWSTIARSLPGRTDNEIKNYWRTHFKDGVSSKYMKKSKPQLLRMQPFQKKQQQQQQQYQKQLLQEEDQFENKLIMFLLNEGDNGVSFISKESKEMVAAYSSMSEQQALASSSPQAQSTSLLPEIWNQSIVWDDLWRLDGVYANIDSSCARSRALV